MADIKPTNDFIFKEIFGRKQNADLLKDLLQSILTDLKIKKVEINKDVSLQRKLITEKLGIMDIVATLDDVTKVNIEVQVEDYHNTVDRSLYYVAGVYHENLEKGQDYVEIPNVISIWITRYNVFKDGPFHEKARLRRDSNNKVLTDKLEIHYIQLPKFRKERKQITTKLDEWLTFIQNNNTEEIKMIKNKHVQKAEEEYEYLTGDAEMRRIAELREKAIRDEAAGIKAATRYGREQGEKKGRRLGRREGQEEKSIEIAKNMLAKKMDIELIAEITGLTREEIEKLKII